MVKPTNPNAPQNEKIYANMPKDRQPKAAAFRPSVSFAAALNKVPDTARAKMQSIRPKSKSKQFNSNPWTAFSSGTKGKEYDIDGGIVWRAIKYANAWFLAKHVGANNDFEFWHVLDWPTENPVLPAIAGPAPTITLPVPSLVPTVLLPSITVPTAFVAALALPKAPDWSDAASDLGDGADWEAIADRMAELQPPD